MNAIATHMRITNLQVTNEDVDTRTAAVSDLVATWGKLKDTETIIAKGAAIAEALGGAGTPSAVFGVEIEGAVQAHASAFLHSERPLEVGIIAGNSGWAVADILGTALWLALSFQPALEDVKREALRSSVLETARGRSTSGAEAARQRVAVNDFGEFTITAGEEVKAPASFKKATTATIEALRRNAALDREELDFLWWSQLGRSRLLNRMLVDVAEPVRLVAAGIEAAGYLRRLPCEVHRDVVLRTVREDPELDQSALLKTLGDDRAVLGQSYTNGLAGRLPEVFPLLHSLTAGAPSAEGGKIKRRSSEWGARALLEAGLVKLQASGPAKL